MKLCEDFKVNPVQTLRSIFTFPLSRLGILQSLLPIYVMDLEVGQDHQCNYVCSPFVWWIRVRCLDLELGLYLSCSPNDLNELKCLYKSERIYLKCYRPSHLTSVCDVKTSVTRLLNCHKRGHSIIKLTLDSQRSLFSCLFTWDNQTHDYMVTDR